MVCKNMGIYRFLCTSWVLITMAPRNSVFFGGGGKLVILDDGGRWTRQIDKSSSSLER